METSTTIPESIAQQPAFSQPNKGFDQLATGLRSALDQFEQTATPENISMVLSILQPIGDFSRRAMNTTVDYTRRHPVRMAVSVCALGLVAAQLWRRKSVRA